ncbi:hypothetical protein TrCOL_g1584 [Triparma columacea]|uniref:Uncharacterized protein n=1 Tax=Triparma columacea TaxID=722753 RepID=A0A9W7LD05_9STRA|nr:hypothetical protein TrCOL_g1584 [Triparma columacea]
MCAGGIKKAIPYVYFAPTNAAADGTDSTTSILPDSHRIAFFDKLESDEAAKSEFHAFLVGVHAACKHGLLLPTSTASPMDLDSESEEENMVTCRTGEKRPRLSVGGGRASIGMGNVCIEDPCTVTQQRLAERLEQGLDEKFPNSVESQRNVIVRLMSMYDISLPTREAACALEGLLRCIKVWVNNNGRGGRRTNRMETILAALATIIFVGCFALQYNGITTEMEVDELMKKTNSVMKCFSLTTRLWKKGAVGALSFLCDGKFMEAYPPKARRLLKMQLERGIVINKVLHGMFDPDPNLKPVKVGGRRVKRKLEGFVIHPGRNTEYYTNEELAEFVMNSKEGQEFVKKWEKYGVTITGDSVRDCKCRCLKQRRIDQCVDVIKSDMRHLRMGILKECLRLTTDKDEERQECEVERENATTDMAEERIDGEIELLNEDLGNLNNIMTLLDSQELLLERMFCPKVEFDGMNSRLKGPYKNFPLGCCFGKCKNNPKCDGVEAVLNNLVDNISRTERGQVLLDNTICISIWVVWQETPFKKTMWFGPQEYTLRDALATAFKEATVKYIKHTSSDAFHKRTQLRLLENLPNNHAMIVMDFASNPSLDTGETVTGQPVPYCTNECFYVLHGRREEAGKLMFQTETLNAFMQAPGGKKGAVFATHKVNLETFLTYLHDKHSLVHFEICSDRGAHYSSTEAMQHLVELNFHPKYRFRVHFCNVGCGKGVCDGLGAYVGRLIKERNMNTKKRTAKTLMTNAKEVVVELHKDFTELNSKLEGKKKPTDGYYVVDKRHVMLATADRAEYEEMKENGYMTGYIDGTDTSAVKCFDIGDAGGAFKENKCFAATARSLPCGVLTQQKQYCGCDRCINKEDCPHEVLTRTKDVKKLLLLWCARKIKKKNPVAGGAGQAAVGGEGQAAVGGEGQAAVGGEGQAAVGGEGQAAVEEDAEVGGARGKAVKEKRQYTTWALGKCDVKVIGHSQGTRRMQGQGQRKEWVVKWNGEEKKLVARHIVYFVKTELDGNNVNKVWRKGVLSGGMNDEDLKVEYEVEGGEIVTERIDVGDDDRKIELVYATFRRPRGAEVKGIIQAKIVEQIMEKKELVV